MLEGVGSVVASCLQQDIADGRLAPAGRLVRDWQEAGERLGKQLELLLAQSSQRKCFVFFSSHSFPELKQVLVQSGDYVYLARPNQ